METVKLIIDGKSVEVPKGKTVLEAAIDHGRGVPYYCYHPGLGVDGSCRVCIVKIEKMAKLQTACSTICTDGMVVITDSPEVVAARASVFEFLLINHPLDCPVCDKGGECPLQDFSYSYGPERSRMEFPRREFDGDGVKADVDFGPTLLLNRNRCILCTRCVRFMREVDGDAQIGITQRGYGSQIATFEEQGVISLLSGNLMDVCPVGAITTRDYRFKARPWDNPSAVDTICTLCERGCNTTAWIKAKPEWAKGAQLIRMTPRLNPEVNGYWMCDIGRFDYHWVEGDRRLLQPRLGRADAARTRALGRCADGGRERGGYGRRHLQRSLPRVGARLARRAVRVEARHRRHRPRDDELADAGEAAAGADEVQDSGRRRAERSRRARSRFRRRSGGRAGRCLGASKRGRQPVRSACSTSFDSGPDGSIGETDWIIAARAVGKIKTLIVQGPLRTALTEAADIVLPGSSFVEKDATYTNMTGHVQAASRVIPPPGDAGEDWQILSKLVGDFRTARVAGVGRPPSGRASQASCPPSPAYGSLASIGFSRPVSARHWLQASNPSERWKWDFMFQDLPPVKFGEDFGPLPRADVIPLKEVK